MKVGSVERVAEVHSAAGLHARPATEFVAAASRFSSEVHLVKGDREVDAKSILFLLTLDVREGDRVIVRASGLDAQDAVDTLTRMVETA